MHLNSLQPTATLCLAVQVLATLLAGTRDVSMLSTAALDQVLDALHNLLPSAAARHRPAEGSSPAGRAASGALHALKLSLMTAAVLLHKQADAPTARPAAVKCLAACFALAVPEVRTFLMPLYLAWQSR